MSTDVDFMDCIFIIKEHKKICMVFAQRRSRSFDEE